MKQKHFMDIIRMRETDSEFGVSNVKGFEVGDHIVIQEKVDGANASFRYDAESDSLIAFSRKQQLSFDKTLNGFWNYVQTLNPIDFREQSNYVFFGEWLLKNAIKYQPDAYFHWYVYDIFNVDTGEYLAQDLVKAECQKHGWSYVDTFYDGPFISWEHCRSFVGRSKIALQEGEGVVIKNQSKLNSKNGRFPFVLKIIGDHFAEVRHANHREKVMDPQKMEKKAKAMELTEQIVTLRRVEKELFKMCDEGLLPEKLQPQDMKAVAQYLPKRIYEDCIKEEQEIVSAAGEYFGKCCGNLAMRYAKEIIIGNH